MPRLRANSVIGTLDLALTAPATPDATETWQQAGTDVLPAVSTADPAHPYVIAVTLDPAELNGAAEIVHITSRGSGTTTNTIKRGQEGTTSRAHPAGTKWVVGPTALDFSETDYVKIESDEQGYDALEVWVRTGYDNVWRRRFGIENPATPTDALVDTDIHSTVVNLGDASDSVSKSGTKLVIRQPSGNSTNLIEAHKKGETDAVLFTLDATGTVTFSNADTANPAIALRVKARTDAQPTFTLDENGSMAWGPGGSTATDVALARTAASSVTLAGNLDVWGTVGTTSTPTASTHLTTKAYVDSVAVGLRWVGTACALATTANITLSGEQTIDGTLTSASRVLVKNQTPTGSQNGIYVTGSGAWTRATDFNEAAEVTKGAAVYVEGGTLNGGTAWTQTATVTTVGTDALVWAQMAGGSSVNAGTGLSKAGNTISVASAGIDSSMLASSAVTTAKIADNAVTTAKIVDGNVTTGKLASSAVTDEKIANDTITPAKLKANGAASSSTKVYAGGGGSWVDANAHSHDASAITSGTFAVARVGSNSGNANAYLNGVGQFVAQSTTGQPLVIVSTVAQLRTAANTNDAHIYVTAGDYVLSASGAASDTGALALNKANQLWELHPDAIISQSTASSSVLNITGSNITFRGGVIEGGDNRPLPRDGRTSVSGGVSAVVIGEAADRITLDGTTIQNARNSAVVLNSPTSVRLSRLYVLNSGSTAIAGTTGADNSVGIVVEGCLVDRTGYQATVNYHGGGIKLKGQETGDTYSNRGMRIIGNDIRQPYMNIVQSEGANNTGNECIVYQYNDAIDGLVANNVCAGGSIGISFSRVNGCTITGNTVYGFSKLGIELAASQFCTVTGNVVDGAASLVPTPGDNHVGIVVWSAHPEENTYPQDNTVIGNTIRKLRARSDTAGIKVQLTGGVEARAVAAGNVITVGADSTGIMVLEANRVTISNNQIRCNEAGVTTNTSAIKLQLGAAASGRYVITGNQLSSANRGIAIVGTGSYQDVACMSNVINSDVSTPFIVDGPTTGSRNVWGANVGSATATTRPTSWVAP